jgi:hypothetical protein
MDAGGNRRLVVGAAFGGAVGESQGRGWLAQIETRPNAHLTKHPRDATRAEGCELRSVNVCTAGLE